jgi:hypothetical protein
MQNEYMSLSPPYFGIYYVYHNSVSKKRENLMKHVQHPKANKSKKSDSPVSPQTANPSTNPYNRHPIASSNVDLLKAQLRLLLIARLQICLLIARLQISIQNGSSARHLVHFEKDNRRDKGEEE